MLGFVRWKLIVCAPQLPREGETGNGWGKRKPALESQTKRVTETKAERETKLTENTQQTTGTQSPEPGLQLKLPSQAISGPQPSRNGAGDSNDKPLKCAFIECLLCTVAPKTGPTACGVRTSTCISEVKKQSPRLRDPLQV